MQRRRRRMRGVELSEWSSTVAFPCPPSAPRLRTTTPIVASAFRRTWCRAYATTLGRTPTSASTAMVPFTRAGPRTGRKFRFAKAFIGLAGVALAAALVFAAVRLLHPAIGPSVRGVSAERLSESGIVMVNPFPWDSPQIIQGQADQIALKQAPGGTVLQTVLAEVVLTNPSSSKPRLCWVVSLPGSLILSHGPPGKIGRASNWYLILIDAHS